MQAEEDERGGAAAGAGQGAAEGGADRQGAREVSTEHRGVFCIYCLLYLLLTDYFQPDSGPEVAWQGPGGVDAAEQLRGERCNLCQEESLAHGEEI